MLCISVAISHKIKVNRKITEYFAQYILIYACTLYVLDSYSKAKTQIKKTLPFFPFWGVSCTNLFSVSLPVNLY